MSSEVALQDANQRQAAEASKAAQRLADQEAYYSVRLLEAEQTQQALRSQLASIEAALQDANERHAAETSLAAARFTESREEADAQVAQAAAARMVIENKLAESEAARQRAQEEHRAVMTASAERLADHQRETEAWRAESAIFASHLETELANTVADLQSVQQQAAIDRQEAIDTAVQRQLAFDHQLTEADAGRQALAAQLQATEAALQEARDRHAIEAREAAARFAEARDKSELRLAQADSAIKVAESKRAEALASLDRVVRQSTAERQAASEEVRQRQAHFDATLRQEMERRQSVEKDLYHTRTSFEEARLQFVNEMTAATERALKNEARLEAQAAEERAIWERARAKSEEEILQLQKEGERLHQSLVAAVQQIRRLESAQQEERSEHERARLAIEGELSRQQENGAALQRMLDETRATAREALERVSSDAATQESRLQAVIADREKELQEQMVRAQAADAAAVAVLAGVEERLNQSLAALARDQDAISRLEDRIGVVKQELESTTRQREAFKAAAGQVPALEKRIDAIHAIKRREFDETPVKRFRCGLNGAITETNAALARMLGYQTARLQSLDFREAVFESGDELQWLVDRCVASRIGESIDTTWKKQDGSRIIVRLMAVATGTDTVDLVAEDITPLCELEDKLRNAQRLEAVARYGSEVAATCHSLLTHVKQEGQQWLARMDNDVARYQGQLLFDDVARAAGFMGQLAAYGEEQRNEPDVVDMHKVLHDLAPVLKRVAGDNIDIVLPQTTASLTVDVEARPVERMLVNVAAYGRERMPLGGRLMIDVDSVVVGRDFVEKYPNVRPGAHVVLTVNEVRSADRPELVDAARPDSKNRARGAANPGVELGTLQALVTDCGGHLWMKAEPPGDMVLKIHLPRRVLDRSEPPPPAMQRVRPGWLQRAFGSRH